MNTKFGNYGGQFAPEVLMYALSELEESFNKISTREDFTGELNEYLEKSPIQLIFLPPYSPELNPIERLWW